MDIVDSEGAGTPVLGLAERFLSRVIILSSKDFISCCLYSLSCSKLVFILLIVFAVTPD